MPTTLLNNSIVRNVFETGINSNRQIGAVGESGVRKGFVDALKRGVEIWLDLKRYHLKAFSRCELVRSDRDERQIRSGPLASRGTASLRRRILGNVAFDTVFFDIACSDRYKERLVKGDLRGACDRFGRRDRSLRRRSRGDNTVDGPTAAAPLLDLTSSPGQSACPRHP